MAHLHKNIRSTDSRTRHPELYTAPVRPAAEDEVSELLAALVFALKPDRVIETGAHQGHTSEKIGMALRRNGVGHLDTIELKPHLASDIRQRTGDLPVTLHEGDYKEFTPAKGVKYHLAFFDATRNARDAEFLHFQPWIPVGAIVVFHDCGHQHPGKEGVDRLEDAGLVKSLFIPTPRGVCVTQVL